MPNRRFFLKQWVAPTIASVVLPAHAQTSVCNGQNFSLNIIYSSVDCNGSTFCDGLTDQEIIDAFGAPTTAIFCVTDEEINAGGFRRDIDLDGNGAASDYLSIFYTIDMVNGSQANGTVTATSVDTQVMLSGSWTANITS